MSIMRPDIGNGSVFVQLDLAQVRHQSFDALFDGVEVSQSMGVRSIKQDASSQSGLDCHMSELQEQHLVAGVVERPRISFKSIAPVANRMPNLGSRVIA